MSDESKLRIAMAAMVLGTVCVAMITAAAVKIHANSMTDLDPFRTIVNERELQCVGVQLKMQPALDCNWSEWSREE